MTMRARIAVATGALVATSIGVASCSTFGSAADDVKTDAAVGADGPIEGSADVAAPDSSVSDGGSSCMPLIDDDFLTVLTDWKPISDDEEIIGGELVLTPGGGGTRGAIWWAQALTFPGSGSLRVQLAFSVTNPDGGPVGNGFGIGWTAALPTEIGGLGESFGFCATQPTPLAGYLFAASTSKSAVSILDANDCNTAAGDTRPSFTLNGEHTVSLVIRSTGIRATLDQGMPGQLILTRDNLAPKAPTTGYLGFAASAVTTSGSSRHTIKSLHVESCPD